MLSLQTQLRLERLICETISDDIYSVRSVAYGNGPEIKSVGFKTFDGRGFTLNVDKMTPSEIGFILLRTGCTTPLNVDPHSVDLRPVAQPLIYGWQLERVEWMEETLARTLSSVQSAIAYMARSAKTIEEVGDLLKKMIRDRVHE